MASVHVVLRAFAGFHAAAVALACGALCSGCGSHSANDSASMVCRLPATTSAASPTLLGTGCFAAKSKASAALVPYEVNGALWADGASKSRWFAPQAAPPATIGDEGVLVLAKGAGVFKEFYRNGQLLETRLLFVDADNQYQALTYAWDAAGSDATLVPDIGATATLADGTSWSYAARSDCLYCHNSKGGTLLGPRLPQVASTVAEPNQLARLVARGVVTSSAPTDTVAWPSFDGSAPLAQRARSYLAANCSFCHRPNGASGTTVDFRFDTAVPAMGICNVAPSYGDLGATGANVLTPGSPSQSVMSLRMHSTSAPLRMPPVGHTQVDAAGTALIDAWIAALTACSP